MDENVTDFTEDKSQAFRFYKLLDTIEIASESGCTLWGVYNDGYSRKILDFQHP